MTCLFSRSTRLPLRRGVTLVELLVSVALTLIVIMAVVRVFDLLGKNVTESRSILELSAQLRTAANQLQLDLDRLTLRPDPPANPLTAKGYFEIIEGVRSDRNNDGDVGQMPALGARNVDLIDTDRVADNLMDVFYVKPYHPEVPDFVAGGFNLFDPNYLNRVRGILGDTDDVWMATVRSDDAPFRGRFAWNGVELLLESNLAEVVWWVEPMYGPRGEVLELALVRRQFLVIDPAKMNHALQSATNNPTLTFETFVNPVSGTGQPVNNFSSNLIRHFLRLNDISIHPEPRGNNGYVALRLNTLDDLSIRRNRFAHWPYNNNRLLTLGPSLVNGNSSGANSNIDMPANLKGSATLPLNYADRWFPHHLNPYYLDIRIPDLNDPTSEFGLGVNTTFIVASDALAFDLRVFDPTAPILGEANTTSQYVLTPTDPGYMLASTQIGGNYGVVAYGAYVDLGYNMDRAQGLINPNLVTSPPPLLAAWEQPGFGGEPHIKSRLFRDPFSEVSAWQNLLGLPRVYDSWTDLYERDGLNQDILGTTLTAVDQGTDGVDSRTYNFMTGSAEPADSIVDGVNERETMPPYPSPLRGVEVIVRMREVSTQQVRQASVVGDFLTP